MDLIALLAEWGLPLVFVVILGEQAGLPLPGGPLLIASGALAAAWIMQPLSVIVIATLACVIADHGWFLLGRRHGRELLGFLCRISMSPDTCVRRTDSLITRYGAPLLLVAKFIPGVSALSIPTAAAIGMPYRRFLAFDTLGCVIWTGAYVGVGMIFNAQINAVLVFLSAIGGWLLVVLALLLAIYLLWKFIVRWQLTRLYRSTRIGAEDIAELIANEPGVVILDARSALAITHDPRLLPGAIIVGERPITDVVPRDAIDRTIVTFCTCPNEASAAVLAQRLINAGFRKVRILSGGTSVLERLGSALPPAV
ncbi:DedA family protein/thiosulfate sulfurtransferase GlpE [soil metagenome]